MEEWKPVLGYEGYYEVSNFGNVKSVGRYVTKSDGVVQFRKPKDMSQVKNKDGYLTVHLSKEGKSKRYRVHTLVAQAFVPGYKSGFEVNHIDFKRTNNRFDNLEWVSHKDNVIHTINNGRHYSNKDLTGSNNPNYQNKTLREKYANDKELARIKQSRPGIQNGRATSIKAISDDGVSINFKMIKECADYL